MIRSLSFTITHVDEAHRRAWISQLLARVRQAAGAGPVVVLEQSPLYEHFVEDSLRPLAPRLADAVLWVSPPTLTLQQPGLGQEGRRPQTGLISHYFTSQ